MESVFKSIGGLDDVYALTQVTGASFRRYTQSVGGTATEADSSSRAYNLSEGRAAAQVALGTAGSVLDSLYTLRDKLDIADGLSIPSQRTDATRYSLQNDINTLVAGIDKSVAQSSVAGINLVSTPSTSIRVQTTDLGGVTSIVGQPLDSASLGISSLSVADQVSTDASRASLDAAIRDASIRYDALNTAVQALSYNSRITTGLAGALSSLSGTSSSASAYGYSSSASATSASSATQRGSLVNLYA